MADKKVSMTVRLSPKEKKRIKKCAKEAGQTISEYVMVAVRERLTKEDSPPGERTDLDLMEGMLSKISDKKPEKKSLLSSVEDRSLMDLIGEYVDKDEPK